MHFTTFLILKIAHTKEHKFQEKDTYFVLKGAVRKFIRSNAPEHTFENIFSYVRL